MPGDGAVGVGEPGGSTAQPAEMLQVASTPTQTMAGWHRAGCGERDSHLAAAARHQVAPRGLLHIGLAVGARLRVGSHPVLCLTLTRSLILPHAPSASRRLPLTSRCTSNVQPGELQHERCRLGPRNTTDTEMMKLARQLA